MFLHDKSEGQSSNTWMMHMKQKYTRCRGQQSANIRQTAAAEQSSRRARNEKLREISLAGTGETAKKKKRERILIRYRLRKTGLDERVRKK